MKVKCSVLVVEINKIVKLWIRRGSIDRGSRSGYDAWKRRMLVAR